MKDISISKEKERGSLHVIVVILLVIALVGALGFIFWQNFMRPKSADVKSSSTHGKALPSPAVSTKPDGSLIILSDWKVKLTVPESLRTTSIEYSRNTKNGQDNYGFTTARIKALGGDCATQPYGKSLLLSRVKEVPANAMDGFGIVNKTPIGGFIYTYAETIPACSGSTTDPSAKVSNVEIDDKTAIVEMFKTLQKSE